MAKDFAANDRVKALRKALGMNQTDFAAKLKRSIGWIWKLERHKNHVTSRAIADIVEMWGVSEDWLRDGAGEMKIRPAKTLGEVLRQHVNLRVDDIRLIEAICRLTVEERDVLIRLARSVKWLSEEPVVMTAEDKARIAANTVLVEEREKR